MYNHLQALTPAGAAYLASDIAHAAVNSDLYRKTPHAKSLGGTDAAPSETAAKLTEALDKRVGKQVPVAIKHTSPDTITNEVELAGNQRHPSVDGAYGVFINPNSSREMFAHELGHIASDQTKFGKAVRDLRETIIKNPKLSRALLAASVLGGAGAGYAIEGTGDADEALAISMLASAPTLIDEGLATNAGLGLLKDAGMRADLGQRGRMAGAYLTYLGTPLLAGLGGQYVGNVLGDDI